jgi:hypothetical protein
LGKIPEVKRDEFPNRAKAKATPAVLHQHAPIKESRPQNAAIAWETQEWTDRITPCLAAFTTFAAR